MAGARRFGLITTNSITNHSTGGSLKKLDVGQLGLAFAIPDHPWTDSDRRAVPDSNDRG